ncbi:hypothetical protein ES703_91026 [subsurface metagenome]
MKTKWTLIYVGEAILFFAFTIYWLFQLPSWVASGDALNLIMGIFTIIACVVMVILNVLFAWIFEKRLP